jgi:hypothetical protein
MSNMTAGKTPLSDYKPYLSIVGATMFGIGIFSLIPKSVAGRWVEKEDSGSIWNEKRPSGSSVVYVNKET